MGKNFVVNGGINFRVINVGDWIKFVLDIK